MGSQHTEVGLPETSRRSTNDHQVSATPVDTEDTEASRQKARLAVGPLERGANRERVWTGNSVTVQIIDTKEKSVENVFPKGKVCGKCFPNGARIRSRLTAVARDSFGAADRADVVQRGRSRQHRGHKTTVLSCDYGTSGET
jgi:hypothetical protein